MAKKIKARYRFVGIIMVVALVLRLLPAGSSFDWAESQLALAATSYGRYTPISDFLQPPLLHQLTAICSLVSQHEGWLRTWGALIPSLLTIWGLYALGRKLGGEKTALAAALLLATSSFHLYFSARLEPYSLAACWAVWSWFFLLERLGVGRDSYSLPKNHTAQKFFALFPVSRDFFLFLACSLIGLYTSYLYSLVLASQWLYLLWRRQWRLFIWAIAIPAIGFLPWWPHLLAQISRQKQLLTLWPHWSQVTSLALWRAPTLTLGKFIFGTIDLQLNPFFIGLTTLFVSLVIIVALRRGAGFYAKRRQHWEALIFMVVVPMLLATVAHFVWPILTPQRLLFLLPGYYLTLCLLLFAGRQQLSPLAWSLFILIIGSNLSGSWVFYQQKLYQVENWRQLLADLHQDYNSSDSVAVFAYPHSLPPWDWYETHGSAAAFPILTTGTYNTSVDNQWRQRLSVIDHYQTVILPDSWRTFTDPDNLLPTYIHEQGFTQEKLHCYPGVCLHLYSRPTLALYQERTSEDWY
ncbi:glycosyltransferase family 39 protein [bacterium]|nr:glycosyltransferase family 39 protein [bacterium]